MLACQLSVSRLLYRQETLGLIKGCQLWCCVISFYRYTMECSIFDWWFCCWCWFFFFPSALLSVLPTSKVQRLEGLIKSLFTPFPTLIQKLRSNRFASFRWILKFPLKCSSHHECKMLHWKVYVFQPLNYLPWYWKIMFENKILIQLYHFIPEMTVGGRWVEIFSILFLMHFNEFSFVCCAERCVLLS